MVSFKKNFVILATHCTKIQILYNTCDYNKAKVTAEIPYWCKLRYLAIYSASILKLTRSIFPKGELPMVVSDRKTEIGGLRTRMSKLDNSKRSWRKSNPTIRPMSKWQKMPLKNMKTTRRGVKITVNTKHWERKSIFQRFEIQLSEKETQRNRRSGKSKKLTLETRKNPGKKS